MTELTCIAPMIDGADGNDIYMNTETAERNGLSSRSPVRVSFGNKSTVALLRYDPNIPFDSIGLSSTIRINVKVQEGELVEISELQVQVLDKVRLQPTARTLQPEEIPLVKAAIRDIYLSKNDHFTVYLNGDPLELQVTRCRPQHGWLTPDVDIQIHGKTRSFCYFVCKPFSYFR